jgi:hypothetical protein
MSSDYRPRGGSSSSSSGGSGGRRRRGGRNRSRSPRTDEPRNGESRSHTNGHSSHPAKKENIIEKFVGWLTGKGKKAPAKSTTTRAATPRHEPTAEKARTPRPERTERPRRTENHEEPVMHEITTPKLYVGNLAYEAAESDLYDLFSKVGSVKNVEVAMDRRSNRSKGFGFVEMETLETAKEASAQLNRTDFMGRQIVVSGAKMDRQSVNRRDDEQVPETAPEANPDSQV